MSTRHGVFWPSYGAFFLLGGLSFFYGRDFISVLEQAKNFVFSELDWLYAYGTLGMVIICFIIYLSPLSQIKIGGEHAKPLLNKKQWFAISLCTTVTAGIMFWATSEPLIHMMSPPKSLGLLPGSAGAEQFALATLFHHWSITSYAIYTIPSLAFALAIYNLKQPFTLAAIFSPILGQTTKRFATFIDGACVFTLVAGFAASLGTGALTISGSFEHHFAKDSQPLILAGITVLLVVCFTTSAMSGLIKGIRLLSNINVWLFFVILALIFLLGPTKQIMVSIAQALGYFFSHYFSMSTFITSRTGDPWPNQWPIFYWSSWLSWAPITAVFLGRISYGHRIRDFIHINLFAPSLFSCIWIGVFGGSAIFYQKLDGGLYTALSTLGPNVVSYELLGRLPFPLFLMGFFVVVTFLSYTTAADSTTDAISALCTKQPDGELMAVSSNLVKLVWAVTIGFVSWILVALAGVEGMKLLSCLGGLPALFLVIGAAFSLIKMILVDVKQDSFVRNLSADAEPDGLGFGVSRK